MNLAEFKNNFDFYLNDFLSLKRRDPSYSSHEEVEIIIKHIILLLKSGGKRIRPYIAWLAYRSVGGKESDEHVFQSLVALELFHMFALIHDDIMDRGIERHGVATMHECMKRRYKEQERADPIHRGQSMAILGGDLVYNWSWEVLLTYTDSNLFQDVRMVFASMVNEVIVGQIQDVSLSRKSCASKEEIMQKTNLKTARYTFVHPLKLGASLYTPLTNKWETFSETVGTKLGIAFQLQDDLLDIIGDSNSLGKKTLSDLREGQPTLYTHYIKENADDKDKKEIYSYFGKPILPSVVREVRAIYERSGTIRYGKKEIAKLYKESRDIVKRASLEPHLEQEWSDLILLLETRTY